jgi:serine/threonine-protein kinase
MYELLCGRVPFTASTFAQMRQKHLLERPEPPSKWQPSITEEIDAIVLRALAKDPAHRFGSMAEMGMAIEGVGTGKPIVQLLERHTLPLGAGTLTERSVIGEPKRAQPRASVPPTVVMPAAVGSAPADRKFGSASEPVAARGLSALAIALLGMAVVVAGVATSYAIGLWGGADPSTPEVTSEVVPASAPAPLPDRARLQFETNVPVVVADLEGRTPYGEQPTRTISLPRSDEPMRLVLRADGYRELHVVITPNQDQVFAAQLEPVQNPIAEPAAEASAVEPEPARERPRPKKSEPELAEPAPDAEPTPKHTFSPEIRDPFGADTK